MTDTGSRPGLDHRTGGPEALFRVGPVGGDAGTATGSMRTGRWMVGPDGRSSAGALGVLTDDMFGSCVLAHRPAGHWAVTIEMTIDFCDALPTDADTLTATSRAVHLDAGGGLGQGLVRDSAGRTVAVGTQRLRFVPGRPAPRDLDPGGPLDSDFLARTADLPMLDLLGVTDGPGHLVLPTGPRCANPMGKLHGGLLLALSEVAAQRAVHSDAQPLDTASINIDFLRPGPVSGDVTFVAEALHRGRTLAVIRVSALRPDGKPCSVAMVTCHASR